LEVTYKANFESNFRRGEQLEARIIDTRGKLYEVDILESELEKERAFRIKRSDELVMLEKALQQQDSDYAAEIDKLERKLAKQQIDTWLSKLIISLYYPTDLLFFFISCLSTNKRNY